MELSVPLPFPGQFQYINRSDKIRIDLAIKNNNKKHDNHGIRTLKLQLVLLDFEVWKWWPCALRMITLKHSKQTFEKGEILGI